MSYKVNFLDNQTITSEALNSITESLGGGALAFVDEMEYGVDDLNAISGSLIGKGVSWGCDLSIDNDQVKIGAGVLFMGDGKRVEIDAEGVLLPYAFGEKNYIWFYHDRSMDFVAPRCTTTEPAGDDYVILGEITEKGSVVGHAELAVMKHSHLGLNHYEEHPFTLIMGSTAGEETQIGEFQLEQVGSRFLIVVTDEAGSTLRSNLFSGYVDLTTGKSFGAHVTTPGKSSITDWGFTYGTEIEGKLQVGFTGLQGTIYKNFLRFSLGSDNILRIYRSSARLGISDGYNLPYSQKIRIIVC